MRWLCFQSHYSHDSIPTEVTEANDSLDKRPNSETLNLQCTELDCMKTSYLIVSYDKTARAESFKSF